MSTYVIGGGTYQLNFLSLCQEILVVFVPHCITFLVLGDYSLSNEGYSIDADLAKHVDTFYNVHCHI